MPPADAFQPTWLCRTPRERARMLDMERRLAPVRHLCFGAIAITLVASGPWFGWWTPAPLALAAIFALTITRSDAALVRGSGASDVLIGLDDDDLIALAPGRAGSLWQELQAKARASTRLEAARATLQRWRRLAAEMAPYEFYATLLDGEGQRARMLARLGPDAADPIDELLATCDAVSRR